MKIRCPAACEDVLKIITCYTVICRSSFLFMPSIDAVNAELLIEPRSFFSSWAGVQKEIMNNVRFNETITWQGSLFTLSCILLSESLVFWHLYAKVMLFCLWYLSTEHWLPTITTWETTWGCKAGVSRLFAFPQPIMWKECVLGNVLL